MFLGRRVCAGGPHAGHRAPQRPLIPNDPVVGVLQPQTRQSADEVDLIKYFLKMDEFNVRGGVLAAHARKILNYMHNRLQVDTAAAIRYTFSSAGPAIVITSVVLLCGFAMLGFSQMNITSNTSVLTCITIAFALIVDLVLVPGLLLRFDRSR